MSAAGLFRGVLDLEELPEGRWAEDRAALIRQLAPLLGVYGRRLYVPEIYAAASPETVVLLCTVLSGGSLQGRLEETCAAYGAQRLALDLERLMMDFPLPCPSGEGIRLSREELAYGCRGGPCSTPRIYAPGTSPIAGAARRTSFSLTMPGH